MKAVVAPSLGPPGVLEVRDIAVPMPGPDDVLIDVKACSINFPDLLMMQGKYQVKPDPPFTPGGEACGEIESAGSNVKGLMKGDRVTALSGWGALAEKLCVRQSRVFRIPNEIDFVAGASTLYTYGTAYHALKDRASLRVGETLLVLGAGGGVGLAAVELGGAMGARVIAASSSSEKLKVCMAKGAAHTINYSTEDLRTRLREITGETGVDVVFDPVGGSLSESALRATGWKGRYLIVGFASGVIQQIPANLPLLKGCSVIGVFWGAFSEREADRNRQNISSLMGMMTRGEISQHIHKIYSLDQAGSALQDLLDRKVIGKAVVEIQRR